VRTLRNILIATVFAAACSKNSTTAAAQGAPADALSEQVMGEVFRISAYRAEYQREAVIVPWADL